ncbi:MAG: hypothetical protein GEU83_12025 [Pseudonocardiaceae bacterium]|nr:hypothetical protein [Pseudonocardiaceae bacterium]
MSYRSQHQTIVDITAIQLRDRSRTDLGDVTALAQSVNSIGLLHPVVVTAEHELVAGERRLAAIQQLGWTSVSVTVVDLDNAADVLQAELEENTCRKALSAYEADVLRQRREEALRPKAAENKGGRGKTAPNLGEVSERRTAKVAATGTGYSGSTLDKVRALRDAAERGVVRQGQREVPAPEQVREIARAGVENVKQTGAAIDREYQNVTKAIDDYVAQDADVQRAQLRRRFWAAVSRAREITLFEPSGVVATLSADEWDDLMRLQGDLDAWFTAATTARGPRLKLAERRS